MEDILRKYKLIDTLSTELNTSKVEFVSAFKNVIDVADIDGFFSSLFEGFSSSENKFKGLVNHNAFKIRKRRRLFSKNYGLPQASGRFIEQGDKLIIRTEIKGWSNKLLFYYGFLVVFYGLFLSFMSQGLMSEDSSSFFPFLPFLLIHAGLMIGLPIYSIRKGVKSLKIDLEREFHYIVSKVNHSI